MSLNNFTFTPNQTFILYTMVGEEIQTLSDLMGYYERVEPDEPQDIDIIFKRLVALKQIQSQLEKKL